MGDSYRPPPPPRGRRGDRYGDGYDYGYGYGYPPPPPRNPSPRSRSDMMDSRRFPPRYQDPPPPRNDNMGFQFRGAAADNYRDQRNFDFRVDTGRSVQFPQEQPPPRERREPPRGRGRNDRRPPPNRDHRGGPPPRKFVPRPAHSRAILNNTNREPTPEQLVGMEEDHQPKFAEYISSSEDDQPRSRDPADEDGPRKRTKVEAEEKPDKPQWSNPDPYSVLPPTDMGIGPKKDIVQTIRKAKMDASANQTSSINAVKENADYISFDDFGTDAKASSTESGEVDDDDDDMPSVADAPPPSTLAAPRTLPAAPPGTLPPKPSAPGAFPPQAEDADAAAMRALTGEADRHAQRGKKRKHDLDAPAPAGILQTAWAPSRHYRNATPWYKYDGKMGSKDALRLDDEIFDFYDYITPYQHESDIRSRLVHRIEDVVRKFAKAQGHHVDVRTFGSFAAGLYLPTADMDIVAVSSGFQNSGPAAFCTSPKELFKLKRHLIKNRLCQDDDALPIPKAKVPIIKFADKVTGIKVDISFENMSGIQANATFDSWKQEFPQMPILVMLIKQLLNMRGLNEVPTGGIGGFTTICLVVSMLQHMSKAELDRSSMAELFMEFLSFYGSRFNIRTTGISMNPPHLFNKQEAKGRRPFKVNMDRLTIVDPNRQNNEIAGGSKNIEDVLRIFRDAYGALKERLDEVRREPNDTKSILECILAGNYTSFDEARAKLLDVNNGRSSTRMPQILPPPPLRDAPVAFAPYGASYGAVPPPAQYSVPHDQHGYQQNMTAHHGGFPTQNSNQYTNPQYTNSMPPPQHPEPYHATQPMAGPSQPNQQMYGPSYVWIPYWGWYPTWGNGGGHNGGLGGH